MYATPTFLSIHSSLSLKRDGNPNRELMCPVGVLPYNKVCCRLSMCTEVHGMGGGSRREQNGVSELLQEGRRACIFCGFG